MSNKPVCVVVGIGPGLGESLARRFHQDGFRVALLARTEAKTSGLAKELDGLSLVCDVMDNESIQKTLAQVRETWGPINTLLWNVGPAVFGDLDQVDVEAMEIAWRTNALGLFVAVKAIVEDMRAAGEGNIIVTGATASRRGVPFTTAFAAGKAAQRSLCQSLARQLWPQGIHVSLIVVDGMVAPGDETKISPDDVAITAANLCQQPRSAWTFELEVRPHVEKW